MKPTPHATTLLRATDPQYAARRSVFLTAARGLRAYTVAQILNRYLPYFDGRGLTKTRLAGCYAEATVTSDEVIAALKAELRR